MNIQNTGIKEMNELAILKQQLAQIESDMLKFEQQLILNKKETSQC